MSTSRSQRPSAIPHRSRVFAAVLDSSATWSRKPSSLAKARQAPGAESQALAREPNRSSITAGAAHSARSGSAVAGRPVCRDRSTAGRRRSAMAARIASCDSTWSRSAKTESGSAISANLGDGIDQQKRSKAGQSALVLPELQRPQAMLLEIAPPDRRHPCAARLRRTAARRWRPAPSTRRRRSAPLVRGGSDRFAP